MNKANARVYSGTMTMGRLVGQGAIVIAALLAWTPATQAATCANAAAVKVPGAEKQEQACLGDLTTAGTVRSGHTDASDWAGLVPAAQKNPTGVPGLQVDGYFPDTSKMNTTRNWNHDAQFVIRLPDNWNGKLIITGAPGVRKQYSPDPVISDWVLSKGYAYASTDKGNSGTNFFNDGDTPGDAIAEWHRRVTELTIATKQVVAQKYGRAAKRTYVTGISNGGYLTRWQLENRADLYDGGVDWEGTLFSAAGPNLFTYLPASLKHYPRYRAGGNKASYDAMIAAGFPRGSEFLWEDHYGIYWDLTQRVYREELDPGFDGAITGGFPFCASGTPMCDADYDYAARGEPVRAAIRKVENTGAIGKPMLTLHGTLDALLPISTDSDVYRGMIAERGKSAMHRYYVIENGNHVDGRYDTFPDRIKPIQPCWKTALASLDAWVENGVEPPRDQFVPDKRTAGVDVANECAIPEGPNVAAAGPFPEPGKAQDQGQQQGQSQGQGQSSARAKPRGLRLSVRRAGAGRFRVTGRLVLPFAISPARACGNGTVVLRLGATRRNASLRANCSFRGTLKLAKRPTRGRATLRAQWLGNRALTPSRSTPRSVRYTLR